MAHNNLENIKNLSTQISEIESTLKDTQESKKSATLLFYGGAALTTNFCFMKQAKQSEYSTSTQFASPNYLSVQDVSPAESVFGGLTLLAGISAFYLSRKIKRLEDKSLDLYQSRMLEEIDFITDNISDNIKKSESIVYDIVKKLKI